MTKTDEKIYHIPDWKNQHCQNNYITQGNLQSQCNSYQITNGSFCKSKTKKS